VIEKLSFGVGAIVLYGQGRLIKTISGSPESILYWQCYFCWPGCAWARESASAYSHIAANP
jgi:hypothetical protein